MTASANSTALIAGCGYVGLRVARMWTRLGIRTFAVTRSIERAAQLREHGIHPIVTNLADAGERPQLPDTDIVLWSVGFDRNAGSTRKAVWIDGLQRLLTSLSERSTPRRILYTSSTSVYGEGIGGDVDEVTEPNPAAEGGELCVAAENILRDYATRSGAMVSVLRLAGIYGPDRLLRRISELRNAVPLPTEPDEWINLVHVDDGVSVIDSVSRCEQPPALMNVVAAGSVTRRVYYSILARLVNAPAPVFAPAGATSTPNQRHGGHRRVTSRVRFQLPITFQFDDCETGLRNAIERSSRL